LLHRMLSTLGFSNVVECENGQDALDTVESLVAGSADGSSQNTVSLMFLDIQMPVLDGPSTARELRKQRHEFPIVAFSASNWKDDSSTPVPLFDAFLPKPISTPVLTEILEKFIRS
jgi:CheY-like chemotaxis protein